MRGCSDALELLSSCVCVCDSVKNILFCRFSFCKTENKISINRSADDNNGRSAAAPRAERLQTDLEETEKQELTDRQTDRGLMEERTEDVQAEKDRAAGSVRAHRS